jgi:hypothetical protein
MTAAEAPERNLDRRNTVQFGELRRVLAARHGGIAGARDFDEPNRAHELDQLVGLPHNSRELEHKAFNRRVNNLARGKPR